MSTLYSAISLDPGYGYPATSGSATTLLCTSTSGLTALGLSISTLTLDITQGATLPLQGTAVDLYYAFSDLANLTLPTQLPVPAKMSVALDGVANKVRSTTAFIPYIIAPYLYTWFGITSPIMQPVTATLVLSSLPVSNNIMSGSYGVGNPPSFTPSSTTAVCINMSDGRIWWWYGGQWN